MIKLRMPSEIYRASGEIEGGSFNGLWHFSFGEYYDPEYASFGALRVFNDDTLSPGAVWPLHYHREIEVVTYCADGEFVHADQNGRGGRLKKGWVQHTTMGRGMSHSEINGRADHPMRFVQMWFTPSGAGLEPHYEQKPVEREDRTGRFFPLVSNAHEGALDMAADARVFSSFLEKNHTAIYDFGPGRGGYLYVVSGGPVELASERLPALGAAMIKGINKLSVSARNGAELLLVDVRAV